MSHVDEPIEAIRAQLAAMQATLDAQQATIAQQQADIAALRQENARAQRLVTAESATRSVAAPIAQDDALEVASEAAEAAGAPSRAGLTSRRSLLRGAAAATAAASVGVVALGATQTAHAAPLTDGSALIVGTDNTSTAVTSVTSTNSLADSAFLVRANGTQSTQAAIYGFSQAGANGVIGYDSLNGTGVYGFTGGSTGIGVHGESYDWIGVYGHSANGYGVLGDSVSGTGVIGTGGATGWGVVGASDYSYDLVAASTGIVGVQVQGYVGAPTTGNFTIGDCIRDANGDLWLCTAGDGTTVGTWVKVSHPVAGLTGGATTYLPKPIRLLDTRKGQSAANTPGSPYLASSTHTIQVAGVTYNGVTTPATCAGAIGNLTVIGGSGTGNYVALVPSGVPFSGTANIAFTAGQVVSNSYNVGLSGGGALDIIMGGGGTSSADVILDLFAIVS